MLLLFVLFTSAEEAQNLISLVACICASLPHFSVILYIYIYIFLLYIVAGNKKKTEPEPEYLRVLLICLELHGKPW